MVMKKPRISSCRYQARRVPLAVTLRVKDRSRSTPLCVPLPLRQAYESWMNQRSQRGSR